jgi:IS6 family transposase
MFKRRRFPVEIILVYVRWYCKYGISYRDLTEMMQERGVDVDPSTIMRWVHRYALELEKRVWWYQGKIDELVRIVTMVEEQFFPSRR